MNGITLSHNIKKAREKLMLTQKEAANLIQVKQRMIESWEQGETVPDVKNLVKICEAFKIDDMYLFSTKKI